MATPAPVPEMSPAVDAVFSTVELLEEILGHLSPRELCRSKMLCRQWRDVVNSSPSLQRNTFLTSKFPTPNPPLIGWPEGSQSRLDFCDFSCEDQGKMAVNELVHGIFDTDIATGRIQAHVSFNHETREAILDFGHAFGHPSQLIDNIKRTLSVNVEITGWRQNERMRDASWQQMLVVDPPATKVLMQLENWGINKLLPLRSWATAGLKMGELVDQVVAQLLQEKMHKMVKGCGNGVFISHTTQMMSLWNDDREVEDCKKGILFTCSHPVGLRTGSRDAN
ncbi:hypothetical protein BU16DRAFT_168204 [Lophium mytilinum]|uniref:F-box domain-containing protein n=1 Tax=Lophium mytilinum TaxID=390894 RepID=A0A6A6QCH2_9PEZI|nr:hypothetical protein BU16DRAFT_168204 [Lophium mytilinum]